MKHALGALRAILADASMYRGILAEVGFTLLITGACSLACLLFSLL